MTIADVSDNLLAAWLSYELARNSPDMRNDTLITLLRLSDSAKQARIKSYLQLRVTSQTTQSNAAQSACDASVAALTSDISNCNTLIGGL